MKKQKQKEAQVPGPLPGPPYKQGAPNAMKYFWGAYGEQVAIDFHI